MESKPNKTVAGPVKEPVGMNRSISLWIDDYDDLFSDFDPRPYSERNVSDDFLSEIKKVCSESDFSIAEIKLLVPEGKRVQQNEEVVIKRLHQHFRTNHQYQEKEFRTKLKKGFLFLFIGMVLMMIAGYLSVSKESSFAIRILFVLTEPAGWFFVWVGLENIFFIPKKEIPELKFFRKLHKSKVVFKPYEIDHVPA
ncbi:MAG: hypothetical protein IAF38_17935 [Bacteroidia bacterium]|nr:hypothetical protein [Bacteroidia bacterium]